MSDAERPPGPSTKPHTPVPGTSPKKKRKKAINDGTVAMARPVERGWKRHRTPRITPPTQAELDALPVRDRQELYDMRRERRWQRITSFGVLFGLIFTAGGLLYTARTWETGQKTLESQIQGQITDRYTKAIEQISSEKSIEVRIGGLYALQRIAQDSSYDASIVQEVIVAFVVQHVSASKSSLSPTASRTSPELPPPPDPPWVPPLTRWQPSADILTALRVLGTVTGITRESVALTTVRFEQANFHWANLRGAHLSNVSLETSNLAFADLSNSNLSRARLMGSDLLGASLRNARLVEAFLTRTNLSSATLSGADMGSAVLYEANLNAADLTRANLKSADLTNAVLTNADLSFANLSRANIRQADFKGANLRGIKGVSIEEIKKLAIIDGSTRF
ncbi:pentapeptide repeat-containing protein [Nonomuraea sp. NPDC004354]